MIISIPTGHSYCGPWLDSWSQGQRQSQVEELSWISEPECYRVFRANFHLLLLNKLGPSALGKEQKVNQALLTWLDLPMPRDRDVHSASSMTT